VKPVFYRLSRVAIKMETENISHDMTKYFKNSTTVAPYALIIVNQSIEMPYFETLWQRGKRDSFFWLAFYNTCS
jgi:hypothetical protein